MCAAAPSEIDGDSLTLWQLLGQQHVLLAYWPVPAHSPASCITLAVTTATITTINLTGSYSDVPASPGPQGCRPSGDGDAAELGDWSAAAGRPSEQAAGLRRIARCLFGAVMKPIDSSALADRVFM